MYKNEDDMIFECLEAYLMFLRRSAIEVKATIVEELLSVAKELAGD